MTVYLSIGAIFKNEAPYLREWLLFHHLNGVERFYLYNNNSCDQYINVVEPFIKRGLVELFDWPYESGQVSAYQDCLVRTAGRSRWVAFIDIDEFLFCPQQLLTDFLRRYEAYPGVAVNWLIYGSNGHINEPEENVVDAYTRRSHKDFVVNRHVKCIVDPRRTVKPLNPHSFIFTDGAAVNERLQPVCGPTCDHVCGHIRLHHYFSKSKAYFAKKIDRGRATTHLKRDWKIFHGHDRNEVFDPLAGQVFEQLQQQYPLVI